ncbi:hypothetical protein EDC01DRAFT_743753 [Geopyxis carbonaria]|nr:hypothetical protein EDC01DRAFT_743753 [Geopyxis carbonaria]
MSEGTQASKLKPGTRKYQCQLDRHGSFNPERPVLIMQVRSNPEARNETGCRRERFHRGIDLTVPIAEAGAVCLTAQTCRLQEQETGNEIFNVWGNTSRQYRVLQEGSNREAGNETGCRRRGRRRERSVSELDDVDLSRDASKNCDFAMPEAQAQDTDIDGPPEIGDTAEEFELGTEKRRRRSLNPRPVDAGSNASTTSLIDVGH